MLFQDMFIRKDEENVLVRRPSWSSSKTTDSLLTFHLAGTAFRFQAPTILLSMYSARAPWVSFSVWVDARRAISWDRVRWICLLLAWRRRTLLCVNFLSMYFSLYCSNKRGFAVSLSTTPSWALVKLFFWLYCCTSSSSLKRKFRAALAPIIVMNPAPRRRGAAAMLLGRGFETLARDSLRKQDQSPM